MSEARAAWRPLLLPLLQAGSDWASVDLADLTDELTELAPQLRFCSARECPGYEYRASDRPHPASTCSSG